MYNLVHSLFGILATDEARTLLRLNMFQCRVSNTYNYTELCDFLKLLAVSACQCLCPYPCFIEPHQYQLSR